MLKELCHKSVINGSIFFWYTLRYKEGEISVAENVPKKIFSTTLEVPKDKFFNIF